MHQCSGGCLCGVCAACVAFWLAIVVVDIDQNKKRRQEKKMNRFSCCSMRRKIVEHNSMFCA